VVGLLDPTTGRFLDRPALREKLQEGGIVSSDRTVTCCGGGIAATVPAFATHVVDDGSLTEWTADPSLPVQVG
jgi:thiosulfate/3-mercaptopyruvate sulfurtransferase